MNYITAEDIYECSIKKVDVKNLEQDECEKYEVTALLSKLVENYLEEKGEKVCDTVRDFEQTKDGFMFSCGSGYDVISVDVLGDGTGRRKKDFEEYLESIINHNYSKNNLKEKEM